jgi:hypothetical protein
MATHFGGMRIIYDQHMVDTIEDWSRVRSPARAARRRKRGFRQNIDYREVPKPDAYRMGDTLIMHPETAKVLFTRAALKQD